MKYLFFDIECCDGNHICSFGYVIVNNNFEILEKKDLVMNPEKRFKLGRLYMFFCVMSNFLL